jgi:hypothetical protein
MKNILSVFVLAILSGALAGCDKDEDPIDCAAIAAPVSTTATLVGAGDTLKLQADIAGNPVGYMWTGPNNFLSMEKDAIVPNVQSNGSGRYTLRVHYGDECVKTIQTEEVLIQIPDPECLVTEGNISLSDTASWTVSSTTNLATSGLYSFTAQTASGNIVIQFPGNTKPVPGVYKVQPSGQQGGQFQPGDARFRLEIGSFWHAAAGKVIITDVSGKLRAAFCDLVTLSQTSDESITVSGQFTEQ